MTIGVLALQGGFSPHVAMLRTLGHHAIEVRTAKELARCDGLILPGGESTTQLRLLERDSELSARLDDFARSGAPILATCAGLILAAREVREPAQRSFGWIDVGVRRNGYGRQLHSGEALADDGRTEVVLIRAPRIDRIGDRVRVELRLHGEPILVREGSFYGATFHPELTDDGSIHARVFAAASRARVA